MNYIDAVVTKIRSNIPSGVSIPENADSLFDMYALLAIIKGEEVTGEDVHNAWSVWMNQINPHHESLVPYTQLSNEVKAMDEPFVEAIRLVSRSLKFE